ncbi:MAG: PaaI family thioesterase [Mycobacteriales bacterium]
MSESVFEYGELLRSGKAARAPGALPAHHPTCFGCGPDAEHGLHVQARLVGEEVHATYTFSPWQSGAPGIAHGGMVAAVVDDVCGFLLFVVKQPAVTRTLNVEYLKPVRIGVPYELVARADRFEGRKLFVSCEGRDPDGVLAFRGGGLFLVVSVEHFAVGTPPVAP